VAIEAACGFWPTGIEEDVVEIFRRGTRLLATATMSAAGRVTELCERLYPRIG
jgi:hypothetical protein